MAILMSLLCQRLSSCNCPQSMLLNQLLNYHRHHFDDDGDDDNTDDDDRDNNDYVWNSNKPILKSDQWSIFNAGLFLFPIFHYLFYILHFPRQYLLGNCFPPFLCQQRIKEDDLFLYLLSWWEKEKWWCVHLYYRGEHHYVWVAAWPPPLANKQTNKQTKKRREKQNLVGIKSMESTIKQNLRISCSFKIQSGGNFFSSACSVSASWAKIYHFFAFELYF